MPKRKLHMNYTRSMNKEMIIKSSPTAPAIFKMLIMSILLLIPVKAWPQVDSLRHYLGIAMKNNPDIMQKLFEYRAAMKKIPQSGSLPDPELIAGVLLQKMELMEGYQVADIKFMQMFPWFGVLRNAKDETGMMARAKYESYADAVLNISFNVKKSWFELNKINQEVKISENNLEILNTIERLTLIRFKSPLTGTSGVSSQTNSQETGNPVSGNTSAVMSAMGNSSVNNPGTANNMSSSPVSMNSMGSQSNTSGLADLYRVQTEKNDLHYNIESLKRRMKTELASFNSLLNRSPGAEVTLPDTIIPEAMGIKTAAIYDSMLINNPMLGMVGYEKKSLEARERLIKAMGFPMLGIGVDYSIISKFPYASTSMNGKDMVMPMVTVTLPVYRKKYKAMKDEVELLKAANDYQYSAAGNALNNEYYQAQELLEDASGRLKLYSDQTLLSQNILNLTLKNYATSSATLTDILRIRQQVLEYRTRLIEAVTDFNVAVAWLKKLEASELNTSLEE